MITAERLRGLLHYDLMTGIFTHLVGKRAGNVAGYVHDNRGYLVVHLDGRRYYLHVLAVLYVKGRYPLSEVDHDDLDKGNNRWLNLREATVSQNRANRRKCSHNTSGFKGVYQHAQYDKWVAEIRKDKKKIHLGVFGTAEEAHIVYAAASRKIFGEFARPD